MERHEDGRLEGRRHFTVQMALALLGGAAVTIGCGGGGSPSGPAPVPAPPDPGLGTVSDNHGHLASITAAQLAAGGALRLDIMGGGPHPHTVDLSADEVARIRNRERVEKNSSETTDIVLGTHSHIVWFN
jgi:hypothetical protein